MHVHHLATIPATGVHCVALRASLRACPRVRSLHVKLTPKAQTPPPPPPDPIALEHVLDNSIDPITKARVVPVPLPSVRGDPMYFKHPWRFSDEPAYLTVDQVKRGPPRTDFMESGTVFGTFQRIRHAFLAVQNHFTIQRHLGLWAARLLYYGKNGYLVRMAGPAIWIGLESLSFDPSKPFDWGSASTRAMFSYPFHKRLQPHYDMLRSRTDARFTIKISKIKDVKNVAKSILHGSKANLENVLFPNRNYTVRQCGPVQALLRIDNPDSPSWHQIVHADLDDKHAMRMVIDIEAKISGSTYLAYGDLKPKISDPFMSISRPSKPTKGSSSGKSKKKKCQQQAPGARDSCGGGEQHGRARLDPARCCCCRRQAAGSMSH
ncbi:hypothetical protein BC828DRAFT_55836 [Blastocladiella britannica]|nr:hypothetical protein BC828DRAFT_55836 [Blastocladiella britannica]